jgi:hypothetical protein
MEHLLTPKKFLLAVFAVLLLAVPSRAATEFSPVDLSTVFNNDGVATAERPSDGNFDAIGTTQPGTFHFAAEGFPAAPDAVLAGVKFHLGSLAPGANNNVVADGQVVPVPAGRYSAAYVLAATTNGSYSGSWTARYTDGDPQSIAARFSDWCAGPEDGEAVAIRSPFRYFQDGGVARDCTPMLYVRRLTLDASRTLSALVLPVQLNTHVFAITLGDGDLVTPHGLAPVEKPQETGPRIRITSDAPMGALLVSGHPVRLSAVADRLPDTATALELSVTDATGHPVANVRVERTSADPEARVSVTLPALAPGYYAVEARLVGGDGTTVHSGLVSVPDDQPAAYRPDSLFGVNAGFDQEAPVAREAAYLARQAGVRWIRQGFGWSDIEPEPGGWRWEKHDASLRVAKREKILTLGLLAYWAGWSKPFTPEGYLQYDDYARAVVSRYAAVPAWEVWNEPNIFYWKGTPQQYAVLLRTATPVIHAANPKAKVVGMATAFSDVPFVKQVLAAGARPDIVSIHPYRGGAPDVPSKLLQFDGGKDAHTMAEETRGIRAAVRDGAGDRPLWYTEVGWWSGAGGVSEETQANYLARTYAIALSEGVSKVFWYAFIDAGSTPGYDQDHFGLLRPDLSPKPAYAAYATSARMLDGARFVSADATGSRWVGHFERGSERITVAWASGSGESLLLPDNSGTRVVYRWDGLPLSHTSAVPLGESPVYIVERPAAH